MENEDKRLNLLAIQYAKQAIYAAYCANAYGCNWIKGKTLLYIGGQPELRRVAAMMKWDDVLAQGGLPSVIRDYSRDSDSPYHRCPKRGYYYSDPSD